MEICKSYGLRAEASGDGSGWLGVYEIPGKDSQFARHRGERAERHIEVFPTPGEAIAAAGLDMVNALNGRALYRENLSYAPMAGAELAAGLAGADLSPAEFARLVGTSQKRVLEDWIDQRPQKDGRTLQIPHWARVLLELFLDKARVPLIGGTVGEYNLGRADEITKAAIRKPSDADAA